MGNGNESRFPQTSASAAHLHSDYSQAEKPLLGAAGGMGYDSTADLPALPLQKF